MAHDGLITIGLAVDDSQWTRTMRHLATNSGRTINQAINAHVQPLGRITGEANEFQKSLAASNARVIAFGASTGAIFALRAAFQQLLRATIDVEQQMTEINSIFQLGGTALKKFSSELFGIANAYSISFADASKAAGEFARQGLTVEETLKRTSAAIALSRIANMDMAQSVSSVTSILNTFIQEALTAEDIVNRMTAVDQAYAISAGDIAEALSRVSSSAADANVSLNQTIGLITAAKQITARTGSVIGNSFKTMFTRLQRPQVIDDLESVGIQARTAEGRVRPMIDILKSLASSYDTLGSAQKSFVAETVGGVYQINILKAVLRDLGSGMSIVDGAMNAAANSTDFVQKRMSILNDTISSQLIRTTNSLTEAFSNVGSTVFRPIMRIGMGNVENLSNLVGKYSNPALAKEGTTGEMAGANFFQGFLKGAGNLIRGPGIQFITFVLLKLFQKLEKFLVDSTKDLMGINRAERERQAINEGIAQWLETQKDLLQEITSGQKNLNDLANAYLESMKGAVAASKDLQMIAGATGERVAPKVTFENPPGAASGYIPNLEISEARRGGYQAGQVLNTIVNNGFQRLAVTANSAESVTRITQSGLPFDFINPPLMSSAGRRHQRDAINQTGIDPYALPHAQIRARGFVPNFALSPELVRTIMALGVKPEEILKKGNATKMSDFHALPENVVAAFVQRYRNDPASLTAALTSLVRRGAYNIPSDAKGLYTLLKGFMLNKTMRTQNMFSDLDTAEKIKLFAEMIAGGSVEQSQTAAQKAAKLLQLRPEDVQRVLSMHGRSIPFIAAYEYAEDTSTAAMDRPDLETMMEFKGENAAAFKFRIPTPIYGFKGAPKMMAKFKAIEEAMLQAVESEEAFTPGEIGVTKGVFFEKGLRAMAIKEGVPVGEPGASLDIHGPVKSILALTNIKHPISAMEIKASASEARKSGHMAQKIFRTLAGEPGSATRKPMLKGPVGYVPPLTNIKVFDAALGGIGIIDADKFGEGDKSMAHYQALIYAAVASGKPLRIHYGPMTTGKTTAAERIVQLAGGMGKAGGYVTDIHQIDSDSFKQFIINKTDRKNLDSGVFGLALSAASQIRGFYSPYETYAAQKEEMVRRLQERNRGQEGANADAIAFKYNPEVWAEYGANMSYLSKKFGDRMRPFDPNNPFAAKGFIPNLNWPMFPAFSMGQIGGVPVRRSSMGVSDSFWNKKIEKEAQKLMSLRGSLGTGALQKHLNRRYGRTYGSKFMTLLQNGANMDDVSIHNNIKGFLGEKFAASMLQKSGLFSQVRGLSELEGMDLAATMGSQQVFAEVRNRKKIGDYGQLKAKFRKAQQTHPNSPLYLIGNNDTHYARGFIPNLASIRRADVSRALKMHGESMYNQGFAATIIKEALQNAFDATNATAQKDIGVSLQYGQQKMPPISRLPVSPNAPAVQLPSTQNRIVVKDTGVGMLPEEVLGKFLPGFTSGKEESSDSSRGQYGLAKVALLGGPEKFSLSTIAKNARGKLIKTIVMGSGKDWFDFASGEDRIEIPDDLGDDGHLEFGGLHVTWMPTKQKQTGTTYRATIPTHTQKGEEIYLYHARETVNEILKGTFAAQQGAKRRIFELNTAGTEFQQPWEKATQIDEEEISLLKGVQVMEENHVPGAIVRVLFNPQAKTQRIYQVPLLNNGLFQTKTKWLGGDAKLPRGFAIDIQPTVGVLDKDYPWTTDREGLKGPANGAVANVLTSMIEKSKQMEVSLMQHALSSGRPIGQTGLSLVDVSQIIPPAFLDEMAGHPHIQQLMALTQKHFQAIHADAVEFGGEDFAKAQLTGIFVGKPEAYGARVGSGVRGSKGLIFTDILSLLQLSSSKPYSKERPGLAFGHELGGTIVHELAHQINRSEGEAHAEAMSTLSGQLSVPVGALTLATHQLEKEHPEIFETLNRMLAQYSEFDLSKGKADVFLEQATGNRAARGFIPNLSMLGAGMFGEFHSLRAFRGTPVGKKIFSARNVGEVGDVGSLTHEYEMAQALHGLNSSVNPLFYFPKVIGSLKRAQERGAIGKEVFEGKTLYDFMRSVIPGTWEAQSQMWGTNSPAGRIANFTQKRLIPILVNDLDRKSIITEDIEQNTTNVMLNEIAQRELLRLAQDYDKWAKLDQKLYSRPRLSRNIATALAKRGARFGMIDPGCFAFKSGSLWDLEFGKESDEESSSKESSGGFFRRTRSRALGFIPNLSAISDALRRENSATGGHATLSSHPLLRTDGNPLGLAAIDKRNQINASAAIDQHMRFMGQSLGEIRRAHTANGFIPNLVEPYSSANMPEAGGLFGSSSILSSILLGVLSNRGQTGESAPSIRMDRARTQGVLKDFTSDGAKAVAQMRLFSYELNDLRTKVLKGQEVTTSFGVTVPGGAANIQKLEGAFQGIVAPTKALADAFASEQAAIASRLSRRGVKMAAFASMGGGLASQIAELSSPSMGAAISEFTSGLTTAGQILIAFPSKWGQAGAVSVAAGALASSFDVFQKGIHDARRTLEMSTNNYQRLTAQIDTLTASLTQYDSMINDAAISFEAIEREQRKYSETLSQMMQRPESQRIAERLEGAADNRSRTAILVEERERATREQDFFTSLQGLREYGSKRTTLFGAPEKVFGVNPFGYKMASQGIQIEQMFRGAASSAIKYMPSELKKSLMNANSLEEFNSALQAATTSLDDEVVMAAQRLSSSFDELNKSTYSQTGSDRWKRTMMTQLGLEKNINDPDRQLRQETYRNISAYYQIMQESAISQARIAQRLFINAGALKGANILDVRGFEAQATLNKALVSGPNSIALRQSMTGIYKQQYGERTIKQYEQATEYRNIEAERVFKIGQARGEADRAILNNFTQTFEARLRSVLDFTRNPGPDQRLPQLNEFASNITQAVNRGLAKTLEKGSFTRFTGPGGQVDIDKMNKAIASASSSDEEMRKNVLQFLRAGSNEDIMRALLETNKQIAGIDQESLNRAQKFSIEILGAVKELDFQQLSNYMGGIKNLMDRSARRATERNLVRGLTLMERGRTAEARATGAATFLTAMKEMQIPIDLGGKGPLSKAMQRAWNIGISNLAAVQGQSVNRALGGVARLTGRSVVTGGMMDLAGRAGLSTAQAAFQAAFRPEADGSKLLQESTTDIHTFSLGFAKSLANSSDALKNFAVGVDFSADQMMRANKRVLEVQLETQKGMEDARKLLDSKGKVTPRTSLQQEVYNLQNMGGIAPDTGLQAGGLTLANIAIPAASLSLFATGWLGKSLFKARQSKAAAAAKTAAEALPEPQKAINIIKQSIQQAVTSSATTMAQAESAIIKPTPLPPKQAIIPKPRYHNVRGPGGRFIRATGKVTTIGGLLALLGIGAFSNLRAGTSDEQFSPAQPLVTSDEITQTGLNAGAMGMMMKTPNMSKVTALKKGGVFSLTSLITDKVGDAIEKTIGGRAGAMVGQGFKDISYIGLAKTFFNRSGALGAAIDVGSSTLRQKVMEPKFGYGAGLVQGSLGSIASGLAFGNGRPAVAGLSNALFYGLEGLERFAETKGASGDRESLNRATAYYDAQSLSGVDSTNVTEKLTQAQIRLTARINELNNLKGQDAQDYSGVYGNIMRLFSGKQFSKETAQELVRYTQQREVLTQAASSGDIQKMVEAVKALQNELVSRSEGRVAAPLGIPSGTTPTLESSIKIDISVKDIDKIPSEIRTNVIEPLQKQLAELQLQVNALVNENNPKPALVF